MLYADAFHCAKWHIKAKAYASNYEVGFLPMCPGGSNDLKLRAPGILPQTGDDVRNQILRSRLQLYFPSLNSLRRLAENSKDLLDDKEGGQLSCLSTDANLYLVFADLLKPTLDSEKISTPETFRQALWMLE